MVENEVRIEYRAFQEEMTVDEYRQHTRKQAVAYTVASVLLVMMFNSICASHVRV